MPKPSKTIGKTNKKLKNTLGPMTLFGDIGPTVSFFSFLVFPMAFDGFGIDLFVFFLLFWFSQWFLIFSTGFTGKPVRRRICLYIFSLLHPLFLTKSSLISQCVAHSSSLDLNIDVASETCVPAIRMFWAGKLNMLHVGYTHVTYVLDVSRGTAGNRRKGFPSIVMDSHLLI